MDTLNKFDVTDGIAKQADPTIAEMRTGVLAALAVKNDDEAAMVSNPRKVILGRVVELERFIRLVPRRHEKEGVGHMSPFDALVEKRDSIIADDGCAYMKAKKKVIADFRKRSVAILAMEELS